MEISVTGAAILLTFLAVVVWRLVRRPMTGTELRRRVKALDDGHTGQDATWASRGGRRVVERRQSQPVIGRGTVARVSGFAGLAIMLLVGLVWVGERYFAPSNKTGPVLPPARVVSSARRTFDPNAARPEPARLELGTTGLGEVFRSPLAPEVPAADDVLAPRLSVVRSGVGTDVVDRELVGRSDTFAVCTRVAFWTHVTGGRPGDIVRHVWFHEHRTVGVVDLAVGGPSWRTHSRRTLAPGAEGDWVGEVRDVEGRVLARHEFRGEGQWYSLPESIGGGKNSQACGDFRRGDLSGSPDIIPPMGAHLAKDDLIDVQGMVTAVRSGGL